MNFYVYQYATGFSAAMALSQKLLHGTQADIEAYLSFLKGGCTKSPVELLHMAGSIWQVQNQLKMRLNCLIL